MVGGGFYEPILISIPSADQRDQIVRLADYVEQHFGKRPEGAWLAERVWEPQLASVLATAGVGYTVLDDIHFLSAGFEQNELFGDYIAEDKGETIRIIPGQKSLRYLIPWDTVDKVMHGLHEMFRAHPGGVAAMGDDMEKFGGWPGTFEHCYEETLARSVVRSVRAEFRMARCLHTRRISFDAYAFGPSRPADGFLHRNDGVGAADANAREVQRAAQGI